MCRCRKIWLIAALGCIRLAATAQTEGPASNLRTRKIPTASPSVRIDTLSIVPGSLRVEGHADSLFRLDAMEAVLHWLAHPPSDSVRVTYRVFPFRLQAKAARMRYDSVMGRFSSPPIGAQGRTRNASAMPDFGGLDYNGSLGRSLSFGNRQDVVLNSSLNLQLNGYIGDSILLAAAITDNNIPMQPDGNTRNLNEFDRVQIRFSRDGWRFTLGDIDVRQQQGPYLNFYKRLQGALWEAEGRVAPGIVNKVSASGAVAKGKFTRNIFMGLEGNQGPYRLKGANSEAFFIVLAGTERVFIDGMPMQRGEDQDYVINYNTAEVTFTPRQMITKDRRIQVEFEYADRNYLNAQVFLTDELVVKERLRIRVGGFSNTDARNAPINQTLDSRRRQFLSEVGDSVSRARYPSAMPDTFSAGKILYEKRDTLLPNGRRDTLYVLARQAAGDLYALSFLDVGVGKGDYVQDFDAGANGKVYKWLGPDPVTGRQRGQYEPAVLLVAPRRQQMLTVGIEYAVDAHTVIRSDVAGSMLDVNTFSTRDKGDDAGFAGRLSVAHGRPIGGAVKRKLEADLQYEYVGRAFRPPERLRAVEFNRDWGLAFDAPVGEERLFHAGIGIRDSAGNSLRYQAAGYLRGKDYSGFRNSLQHRADLQGWRMENRVEHTAFKGELQSGAFFRPTIGLEKILQRMGGHRLSLNYALEHNAVKDRKADTVVPTSFSFDVLQMRLSSPAHRANRWGLSYFTRADRLPLGGRLERTDRSHNLGVNSEWLENEHHQLRMNATFRTLRVLTDRLPSLKPDETLLGRVDYQATAWKGALTGNVLYELGTGQEPRRDFSYLEVPAGQGEYAWMDYNADGIQQLNEFEVARFRDQAMFIRVFTPTSQFMKANYLQFNYNLVFNPRVAIQPSQAKGLQRLLVRTYLQSSLQVARKQEAEGLADFNPFTDPFSDTSLLTLDRVLSNSFSFNRTSPRWGVDVNNIRTSGRAFLSYGYETRSADEWTMKARYNAGRSLTIGMQARLLRNRLSTPGFVNRNFHVGGHLLEPRLTYTKGTELRAHAAYVRSSKRNIEGAEQSLSHALQSEFRYNILSNTSLTARFTYTSIDYNGKPNTAVSYLMLEGLMPGGNHQWAVDLTKRLSGFLELGLQYEGRKAGSSGVVHVGRAQLRALF